MRTQRILCYLQKIERDKRWKSHRWSGWPGAFCQDCFIDDPLEQAVADNIENTDKWDCPLCRTVGKEKQV